MIDLGELSNPIAFTGPAYQSGNLGADQVQIRSHEDSFQASDEDIEDPDCVFITC